MTMVGLRMEKQGISGRLLSFIHTINAPLFFPIDYLLQSLDLIPLNRLVSGTDVNENEFWPPLRMTVTGILSLLILLLSALIMPILHYHEGHTLVMESGNVKYQQWEDKVLGDEDQHFFSDRLKMQSINNLGEGRYALIPNYEYYKIKKSSKFEPVLSLYDWQTKNQGKLVLKGKVAFKELLLRSFIGDPLFPLTHPYLYKEVMKKSKSITEWGRYSSKLGVMNPLAQEELGELVKTIFEFDLMKYPLQSISYGPFYQGKLWLRTQLRRILEVNEDTRIVIKPVGNFRFIVARHLTSKGHREVWMPLGTFNPLLFELSWEGENSLALGEQFKMDFLNKVNWYFDYENFYEFPLDDSKLTAFQIFDLLSKNKIEASLLDRLEQHIYRYFYQYCRMEFQNESMILRESLNSSLDKVNHLINLRNRSHQNFSTFFQNQMESLRKAYRIKDRKYFNL